MIMNTLNFYKDFITNTKSKFFTVVFVKKNGEERTLVGQTGVTKFLQKNPRITKHGSSNTTAHLENYMTVYDIQKKAYRNVNLETIKSIKCGDLTLSTKEA